MKLERWDGVKSEATNIKGDYLTNQDDVKTAAGYVGSDKLGNKNGYFIWSYRKDDYANGVTHDYINKTCKLLIGAEMDKVMQCPWCANFVSLVKQ